MAARFAVKPGMGQTRSMRLIEWMIRPVSMITLVAVMAAGCAAEERTVPPDAVQLESEVLFELSTTHSAESVPARRVIRDASEWAQLLPQIAGPEEPAPAIDFAQNMVVVAAMGEQRSGGHSIVIDGVFTDEAEIYIEVNEVSPGPECVVSAEITSPVTAVAVPRRSGGVVWVERASTLACDE